MVLTRQMRRRTGALLAAGAIGTPALAEDDPVGTFLWEVTTQDGDALVEPGETATVSVLLDLEPDPLDDLSIEGMQGLSALIFDVIGDDGAANGQILGWTLNSALTWLTGDLTTTDGVSLFSITLGQIATGFGDLPATEDPLPLLDFEWEPVGPGAYDVQYAWSTEVLEVWYGTISTGDSIPATPIDTSVAFSVVPGPASAVPLAALALFARRRRG